MQRNVGHGVVQFAADQQRALLRLRAVITRVCHCCVSSGVPEIIPLLTEQWHTVSMLFDRNSLLPCVG